MLRRRQGPDHSSVHYSTFVNYTIVRSPTPSLRSGTITAVQGLAIDINDVVGAVANTKDRGVHVFGLVGTFTNWGIRELSKANAIVSASAEA